jgi:polyisoprenyl-phosphate glycosyltransferase
VPCYNERETLPELHRQVTAQFEGFRHSLELVLVDDGSRDGTTDLIRDLADSDPCVHGVILSRNFGHEAAIEAGLHATMGDAVIVMDADLQDSPGALERLVDAWEGGADVVYAVRKDRKENALLRAAFSGFYRLAERVMSVELPRDAGPFCLMSRKVVNVLNALPEHGRYFPGLRAFAGFRQVPLEVERLERLAGVTKYSFGKRTAGAINALVSFSKLPLRLVSALGIVMAGLSLVGGAFVIVSTLAGADLAPGWASIITIVLLLSGIQFLTLGIVGEYVGKVYDEVRRRPSFIVGEDLGRQDPGPPE